MFYPKNFKEKLGLDQVIELAKEYCETSLSLRLFTHLKPSTNYDVILMHLEQTNEIKAIIEEGQLSFSMFLDFDLQKEKTRVEGFYYLEETIGAIKDVLYALRKCSDFFKEQDGLYPHTSRLFSDLNIDFNLISEIERILDPENQIKPNASAKLQKISGKISQVEKTVLKSSNALFNKAKDQGILAETELGIKNGRVVLPVLSEHKRKVDGVLIDQSGTGKISYMEPLSLIKLNNELAELHIQKRQEIISILKSITAKIAIDISEISKGIQKLGVFDFIRAKARLAIEWKCIMPKLGNETLIENAIHPLLRNRLLKDGKEVVSTNYNLNESQRIIVISGPNAGGKSVALKTLGLLQLMVQSGFLVPCNASSIFRVFENVFVDLGDNQSIESDLSTYSSHLKAAKHIINFSDENTMVLIDEIGTGTDPMFGGPMAEAILEQINDKGAYGIITTHFSNIKVRADKLKGVSNAAMLFDMDKLLPIYKLKVGRPGSSFVYEVAANIGLNKKVIKRAKKLTNTKQIDFDKLLAEVQTEKERLDKIKEELEIKLKNTEWYESEYKSLKSDLEEQQKRIIQDAKQRANDIIKAANKDIEKAIRDIKESNANKTKTALARKKLSQKQEATEVREEELVASDFKVGDNVQIKDTDTIGEITEIKKKKVKLAFGEITTTTTIDKIEKVGKKTEKQVKKYISSKTYSDRQQNFTSDKDIRGMRTYDALKEVDEWIDSALILGVGRLRLLHGKGNGILKNEIRKHLKPNPAVAKIYYERVDLGGEGISIIELS